MFLHLYIGDLQLHKLIKDSKHLKLSISINDDNKQTFFSDNYLLNNIIRFNQNIQFNLQNEPYQLIELRVHLFSIQIDGISEQEIGFKTIQCFYNASKSMTNTIGLLDNNGIPIGNLPITYFYYKTAIKPNNSLTIGQYQPNIQEYSFLLSRKIRNPQKAKPVSFNPDIEQRINIEVLNQNQRELLLARRRALAKDTRNISTQRLKNSQLISDEKKYSKDFMTYSPKKNSHRNLLLHSRGSTYDSRHKNINIIKAKVPPKLRNTSMSVGYVKNKWPDDNEGIYEKKLYRLQTAQEMKLQILKDIAQELQVRNQHNSYKNDFIRLRKRQISTEEELRMKKILRNKESEVKLLKNTLSHLRFNNVIQANESASKPICRNFDSSISNIAQEILNSSSYRTIDNLYPKSIKNTSYDQKKIFQSKSLEIKPTYKANTISRLSTSSNIHSHPQPNKVLKNTISSDKKIIKKYTVPSVSKKSNKKFNNYDASKLCDKSKNKMNSFLNSFTTKKDNSINSNSNSKKAIPIKQNTPNRSSITGKPVPISIPTSSLKSPLKNKQDNRYVGKIAGDWLAAARTSLHQLNQNPMHKHRHQSLVNPHSKNKIRSNNKNREYNDILSNYVKQLDEIVLNSSDEESYRYMEQIKDEWDKIEQFDDSCSESSTEDISDSLINQGNKCDDGLLSSNTHSIEKSSSEDSAIQVDYSQIPGYENTQIAPRFLSAFTDDEFYHDEDVEDDDEDGEQLTSENILEIPCTTHISDINDNDNDITTDDDIKCKIIRDNIMNEILFDKNNSSLISQDSLIKQIHNLSTSNEEINSNHKDDNNNNISLIEDYSNNFAFKLNDDGSKFITKKSSKKEMILNQFEKNRKYKQTIQPQSISISVGSDQMHSLQLELSSHSKISLHQESSSNNNNLIHYNEQQHHHQKDINLNIDDLHCLDSDNSQSLRIHHYYTKRDDVSDGINQKDLEEVSEVQAISFDNEKNNKVSNYVNSGSDVQVLFDDFSTDSSSSCESEQI